MLLEGHKIFKNLFFDVYKKRLAFSEGLNFIIKCYVLKIKTFIISKMKTLLANCAEVKKSL